jgi:ABC-type nickel/cobalt efflux system permease component RcnA
MLNEIGILIGTASIIGFLHTILGPDHYLPFIVLSKARQWNLRKTIMTTFLCGIAHVLSSVILGFIGVTIGVAIFRLGVIESFRGELSAWFLIIFGFTYFIWGIHKAIQYRQHDHFHLHEDGKFHSHPHNHISEHSHVHTLNSDNFTPWILFIIFVFGPCEPLIPLVMYTATNNNMIALVSVISIFSLITVSTMLCIVLSALCGLSKLPIYGLEKYLHALAGLTIFLCGSAIKFLGL